MIEKHANVPFCDDFQRITVLEPKGRNLVKLASVLPEVESFTSRIAPDDGYYWIHLIALTASEIWGQNRNGDHWSYEALSHFPEGWTGDPSIDRELSRSFPYGGGTYYNANVFPHHQNSDAKNAIGSVELVTWNPVQSWIELVVKLDKSRTSTSRVKWVLDRIARGAPFDVSMGAKVPFDMATTGDMQAYWAAQQMFDPRRHRSPAEAVLEEHRRRKSVDGIGIRGLSITRTDYVPECKNEMGKLWPNGIRVGVRNDYPRFFDISIVWVGADKVAKYIAKYAGVADQQLLTRAIRAASPISRDIDRAWEMSKAASAKGAAVNKRSDIDKEIPAAFDDKSVRVLADNDPELPRPVLDKLHAHPDTAQALSTASALGIVFRPGELHEILGGRPMPRMNEQLFAPELAAHLLGSVKRRSAFDPVSSRRMETMSNFTRDPQQYPEPDAEYLSYRQRLLPLIEAAEKLFAKNPDLMFALGGHRQPVVGKLARRYSRLAFLPRELTVEGGEGGEPTQSPGGQISSPPQGEHGFDDGST